MENKFSNLKVMLIKDLLKHSFALYIDKAWLMIKIALFGCLGVLPATVLAIMVFLGVWMPFQDSSLNAILFDILWILIAAFFLIVLCTWSQVALFSAVKGKALTLRQSLSNSIPNILPFLWISFLYSVAVIAGFIVFIIPGIIFMVWFYFALYVFFSEGLRGISALKRSKELVKGYWWPMFGRIIFVTLIASLLGGGNLGGSLVQMLLLTPFAIVFSYVLYDDLKKIKKVANV